MILHVPAAAPWYLHAGAALLLTAHMGGGSLGMASGAVAMVARKGGRLHRRAGNVFFAAMLAMAGVGATVAPFLPDAQWTNTMAGVCVPPLSMSSSTAEELDSTPKNIMRQPLWAIFRHVASL